MGVGCDHFFYLTLSFKFWLGSRDVPSRMANMQILTSEAIPPDNFSISRACWEVGENPDRPKLSYSVRVRVGRFSTCSVAISYRSPKIFKASRVIGYEVRKT